MTERVALKLGFRRILSIIPGAVALAVPLAFGLVYATPNRGETQREDTAAKLPAYDVAAIKPDKSGMGPRILFSADRLTATRVTLKFLIKMAYGVEDDQILGASNWLNSETYDIEAKVDSSEVSEVSKLSDNQRMVMFQRLLADRFKLALHRETKELPVYALVIAKNGPKLQEAKPGDTYPNGIKGPDGKPAGHAGMMMWGRGRLTGQGIPIASLVPPLSQQLSRTVQDRTGLTGKYDIELHWTPDDAADPMTGPQGDRPTSENGNSAESPEPFVLHRDSRAARIKAGFTKSSRGGPRNRSCRDAFGELGIQRTTDGDDNKYNSCGRTKLRSRNVLYSAFHFTCVDLVSGLAGANLRRGFRNHG